MKNEKKEREATVADRRNTIPSGMAHRALLKNSQSAQPTQPDFTKRRPGSLSRSILAMALFALFQISASATITVTGLVSQITSAALETKITFTPASDILLLTNGLSAGPAKTISSAANGGFTNTFNPGTYLVRLPLVSGRNAFTIAVPHGNGIENITNLIAAPWTYEQFVNTIPNSAALTNNDTRLIAFQNSLTLGAELTVDQSATFHGGILGDGSNITNLNVKSLTNFGLHGSNNLAGQIVASVRSNSLVIGNPNRSNGVIHIKDGAIWMPSARSWNDTPGTSTYAENKHSGVIYWHGALGTNLNEPRLDSENQDGFAKIGAWWHWGGSATYPSGNPWLKVSARELRLEEGYANDGTLGRQIHIGNEDHFGRVFFNYTPVANAQTNAYGRGRPVGFTALATDANGAYDNYAQPGIQSVAIPGANRVTVGADTYGLGELRFYSAVPSPSTAFQTNTWNATPGVEVMRMGTNSFTVLGSGGITGNGVGLTNVNMTNITFTPNGVVRVAHNFSFKTTNSSQPGVLAFNATAHGAGRGIVLLGATEGDVVINPMSAGGILQLGMSGNSGSYNYMQYASFPTASFPVGFSHPLQFRSTSYNGGATAYKYPGIVGFPSADDASELGKISIYARAPHWNNGNANQASPNEAGTKVVDFDTNGIVAAPNIVFKGNGAGITNQNYACFQRIYFNNAGQTVMPAATWTNVTFTTNVFAGQNHDSGAAFTLSNSFIIVNAAGAGRWKVRATVPFYDGSSGGNVAARIYRFNNSPQTVMPGQGLYQWPSSTVNCNVVGSVVLTAGDIIAVQAFGSSATWQVGKLDYGGFNEYVASATLEFERQ